MKFFLCKKNIIIFYILFSSFLFSQTEAISVELHPLNSITEKKFEAIFPSDSTEEKMIYNTTISDKIQFVWFRVAKTGTRTLFELLKKNQIPFKNRGKGKWIVFYEPKNYLNYFKFTIIRNPWDRLVSCYSDKVLKKSNLYYEEAFEKDFKYFIKEFVNKKDLTTADCHIRLQSKLFPINELDFIGRFESLEEDLKFISIRLGIKEYENIHLNASQHMHYSTYYDEECKNIVFEKYRADIELFHYHFENLVEIGCTSL